VVVGLTLAMAVVRPADAVPDATYEPPGSDEPVVPEALSGTFFGSPAGFFVCTVTATSPVDTPDCFLGYVVPDSQGRLRAVAGGFQRSSNFTVLEEVSAEGGAFTVGGGSAEVDVTFPELGRLQARFTAGSPGPGWANSACPKAVLAYALAASAATTVYPVAAVDGTLSRNLSSEDVSLYEAPRPVTCFAYFTGPANGAWRMSRPHSAGHRRFEEPVPVPASALQAAPRVASGGGPLPSGHPAAGPWGPNPTATGTSRRPGGPAS